MTLSRLMLVCVMMTSLSALSAIAAEPAAKETAEKAEKKVESYTRVYDVRDLLVDINDYPYSGDLGVPKDEPTIRFNRDNDQQPTPTTAPTLTTKQERSDELVKLILDTVATDSWRDNGGTEGAIRMISGQMIVTQTADNQKLVQSILSQLRESTFRMIRIQARWLLLSPADAKALLITPTAQDPGTALVDPASLEKLPPSAIAFRGEVTCFNVQTVSMSSGRTHSAITKQDAVVAQGAVAMSPVVKQVQSGIMLEVQPTLQTGKESVVLDVKSRLVDWSPPTSLVLPSPVGTTRPADQAVAGAAVVIPMDRLNMLSQDLKTAVRLPLGKPVLVGGLTLDPAADPSDPSAYVQLYLVVKVDATREEPEPK